jgi:hypothetical protein
MENDSFDFGSLFMASKGKPLTYKGQTLVLADRIPAKPGDVFLVTMERTNSSYVQGVACSDGVEVFGERVKRAVVWEYCSLPLAERSQARSRLPFTFEITCRNKSGYLSFYNMALLKGGQQSWWHWGACMIPEEIPGGRRYRCNDFQPNDDFDDIIFSVVRKKASARES